MNFSQMRCRIADIDIAKARIATDVMRLLRRDGFTRRTTPSENMRVPDSSFKNLPCERVSFFLPRVMANIVTITIRGTTYAILYSNK